MDAVQIVFMTVIKQQIVLDCIRVLSEACNFASIKKALQNKLVRRVNGNPKMMNEIYRQIRKICKEDWHEYSLLEAR